MKRIGALLLAALCLTGCKGKNEPLKRGMELRASLLSGSCSFLAQITADYGDSFYTFEAECTGYCDGRLEFTVTQPESIAGIKGAVDKGTGNLIFDGTALEFPLLADGQVTPVSAPWLFLKTLQGGYLTSAGEDGDRTRLTINDSYEEEALQFDIWLDENQIPVQADILYAGRRILAMTIEDFTML